MGETQRADDQRAVATPPPGLGQAESISGQIARARRLLESSLAQLRESFLALTDRDPAALDTDHNRQHFERAVIALQSEDTIGQLLILTGRRAEELERTLEHARALVSEILADPGDTGKSQPCQAHRDDRLAALFTLLDLSEADASPSVGQHSVSPGALQLF